MKYILTTIASIFLILGAQAQNKTFTANGVSFEMVKIDGGTFKMGMPTSLDPDDVFEQSHPVHDVTLSTYYMSKFPVTQTLWRAVMGEMDCPSLFWGDNFPVDCITWYDAMEFIEKLNKLTGENFGLPTEAQWELAYRGGIKNAPNSNKIGNDSSPKVDRPIAVDQERANALGIYGLYNGMIEWCSDYFDFDYYKNSPKVNPQGPGSGIERSSRSHDQTYPFVRSGDAPRKSNSRYTMRLVLNVK